MTGNTQQTTIHQVKEEVISIVSKLNCVKDCFIEFDEQLNINKIVIIISDFEYDPLLRVLLRKFINNGIRIVFREQKPLFPF